MPPTSPQSRSRRWSTPTPTPVHSTRLAGPEALTVAKVADIIARSRPDASHRLPAAKDPGADFNA